MGTTSEKLTYLNTTKTLIKEELNLGGANITNEPFRAYKDKLEGIYKDFLANGTDTLWNNWEKVSGSGTSLTLNNTIEAKMGFVYKGNTSQDGTPTPDTPIPVQVVSGDNTIKVEGKNLFQTPNTQTLNGITLTKNTDGTFNLSGTATANTNMYLAVNLNDTKIQNGTYTISRKSTGYNTQIDFYNGNSWLATSIYVYGNNLKATSNITIPNNATMVRFIIYVSNGTTINLTNEYIQLEKGSTATEYEPYQSASYPISLGNIELCKIGDYQDKIAKSSGKNLCNIQQLQLMVNTSGKVISNSVFWNAIIDTRNINSIYISGNYSLLGDGVIRIGAFNEYPILDTQGTRITYSGNSALDTTNYNYVLLCFTPSSNHTIEEIKNSFMINEGTTALPYEPYGKVWYLNKQIGKVVYTGASEENWQSGQYGTNSYYIALGNRKVPTDTTPNYNFTNLFRGVPYPARTTAGENIIFSDLTLGLYIRNTSITSIANLKTMLGTTNLISYYVLATPTYEEITDTTLISQLEAIKKSYNTQTNISQENNDMPFELDVVALGELESI